MSAFGAAAAAAGAKAARKELRRFFGKALSTDQWKLAGRYDAEPRGDGWYLAKIDPNDPLRLEHVPTGQKLVVPFKELLTDFASVPRLVQSISKSAELVHFQATSYRDASLLHDMLYAAAWCWAVKGGRAVKAKVTKGQADAALFVALECSGATLADGLAYHGAVTLFGGAPWRRCREKPAEWPELLEGNGAPCAT